MNKVNYDITDISNGDFVINAGFNPASGFELEGTTMYKGIVREATFIRAIVQEPINSGTLVFIDASNKASYSQNGSVTAVIAVRNLKVGQTAVFLVRGVADVEEVAGALNGDDVYWNGTTITNAPSDQQLLGAKFLASDVIKVDI